MPLVDVAGPPVPLCVLGVRPLVLISGVALRVVPSDVDGVEARHAVVVPVEPTRRHVRRPPVPAPPPGEGGRPPVVVRLEAGREDRWVVVVDVGAVEGVAPPQAVAVPAVHVHGQEVRVRVVPDIPLPRPVWGGLRHRRGRPRFPLLPPETPQEVQRTSTRDTGRHPGGPSLAVLQWDDHPSLPPRPSSSLGVGLLYWDLLGNPVAASCLAHTHTCSQEPCTIPGTTVKKKLVNIVVLRVGCFLSSLHSGGSPVPM